MEKIQSLSTQCGDKLSGSHVVIGRVDVAT